MKILNRVLIRPELVLIASLAVLFSMTSAYGQDARKNPPALLKDIKQSGESCRRADLVDKPSSVVQRDKFVPDLTCKISTQELLIRTKTAHSIIVDTRPAGEYTQYRIDRSINVPLNEVVHKAVLRKKSIVLIGTGKLERELYTACSLLKSKGFTSVKVLQGGILAWIAADQAVLGRAITVDQLQRLEPAELYSEGKFASNLVVVAASEKAMLKRLDFAVSAPQDNAQGLKQVLEQQRRNGKYRSLNAVVWVTSAQTKPEELTSLRAMAAPLPFMVYSEGEASFQKYMSEQNAVWLAQARGPKQPTCGL